MELGPSDHHLNTFFNHNLSDIRRLRLNRAFGSSWGDGWTHLDASMKIRRAENQGSWDRGRPFVFIESDGPQFLHDFLIKTGVLHLCNLTLD